MRLLKVKAVFLVLVMFLVVFVVTTSSEAGEMRGSLGVYHPYYLSNGTVLHVAEISPGVPLRGQDHYWHGSGPFGHHSAVRMGVPFRHLTCRDETYLYTDANRVVRYGSRRVCD